MRKGIFLPIACVLVFLSAGSFARGNGIQEKTALLEDIERLSETVHGYYTDLVEFLEKSAGPVIGIGMIPRKFDDENGFKVLRVFKNKPADIAGIKEGDIIVALDGIVFNSLEKFRRALNADNRPDRMLTFTVRRDGENITIKVKTEILRADKTAGAQKLLAAIKKESQPILNEVKARLDTLYKKIQAGSLKPEIDFSKDPDVLQANEAVAKFISWYEQRNREAEDLLRIRYE